MNNQDTTLRADIALFERMSPLGRPRYTDHLETPKLIDRTVDTRCHLLYGGTPLNSTLPIRGRDEEIDNWLIDEYADQEDGHGPDRFDPELFLAFL